MLRGILMVLYTTCLMQSVLLGSYSLTLWEDPGDKDKELALKFCPGGRDVLTGSGCYVYAERRLSPSDREIPLGAYRITLDEANPEVGQLAELILYYKMTPLRVFRFRYSRNSLFLSRMTAVDVYDGRNTPLYRITLPGIPPVIRPPDE